MTCGPLREAVGVFEDESYLEAAVDDLPMSDFDRSDICVLVGRRRVGRKFGAVTNHAPEWAYEPEAPSTAYGGNDARTPGEGHHRGRPRGLGRDGSCLCGDLVRGLAGGAISLFLEQHHAEYVRQQLACGGAPVVDSYG